MAKFETWENPSDSTVSVVKMDSRGNQKNETVPGHQKFTITEEDRILNQELAAMPSQDLFTSGLLIPIGETARILNGNESDSDIASNPNMMSDSDLKEMFKIHYRNFPKEVGKITSVVTLARLLDIASEIDATVKQVAVINDRMIEVDPSSARGDDVIIGRVKKEEGFQPRGLDGDDPDYKRGRS